MKKICFAGDLSFVEKSVSVMIKDKLTELLDEFPEDEFVFLFFKCCKLFSKQGLYVIDDLKKVIERKDGAFTQLRVRNTDTGVDHAVGSSSHDALFVENGRVRYYNMQDGGSDGDGYRFVEKMLWGLES